MKSYDTESRNEMNSTPSAQKDAGGTEDATLNGAANGANSIAEASAGIGETEPSDKLSVSESNASSPKAVNAESSVDEVSEHTQQEANGHELPQNESITHIHAENEPYVDASSSADDVTDVPAEDDSPVYEAVTDDETQLAQADQPRFQWPSRAQVLEWLPFVIVVLLGAVLRFWGLGDKPLHHDESLHAYYSLQFMHQMENWANCLNPGVICYRYDPLLHGPFQFHAIALSYKLSQILGAPDNGVNTFTVRIPAALLGSLIVALPFFLRDFLGKLGAFLACFFLAVSPSMVYFSRFAREDIYMACFTLLMVVAVARYLRTRKMLWLVIAAAGFALSYATKEATFLTIAVFGSFLGALIVWELGLKWSVRETVQSDTPLARYLPRTGAPICLFIYGLILAPIGLFALHWMKDTSIYITTHQQASDQYVQQLKDTTVNIVPWIGILIGVYVLSILIREMLGRLPISGRHGLARRVDPEKQTLLDTILTMPWTHWFFALLCGWAIFLILFTVLFTNIRGGIGDGVWQGLYYWLEQQQVARGGQPWYYYLLLIPLYEQVGLVFGIAGIVRCLMRPTRFRLFLVYWFVGNVFIYSWAAEKMPWLMIHMTMPMMILAAIGLEPAVMKAFNFAKQQLAQGRERHPEFAFASSGMIPSTRPRIGIGAGASAILVSLLAVLLLAPTLENLYQVTYVHPADGPHEMMIYVQTTTDVDVLMSHIDALDQKLYGGKHLLAIGLQGDATWPLIWYLRDYPNVCLNYPGACPSNMAVIIAGGDDPYGAESRYAPTTKTSIGYNFHQYHMRSWWDEGYKPPPCVSTPTNNCADQPGWGGVGPALWLSYGDSPPPGATFDLGRAIGNVWQWWWQRKPFGSTTGNYDMVLFIRKDLGVNP